MLADCKRPEDWGKALLRSTGDFANTRIVRTGFGSPGTYGMFR